jgi:hypothetical protein
VLVQSPLALAPELLELVSVAFLHRFHSADWFAYLSKKLPLSPGAWRTIVELPPGTQFTCFTGTKVQMLTQKTSLAQVMPYSLLPDTICLLPGPSSAQKQRAGSSGRSGTQFTCFTSTKVQILTHTTRSCFPPAYIETTPPLSILPRSSKSPCVSALLPTAGHRARTPLRRGRSPIRGIQHFKKSAPLRLDPKEP